MTNLTDQILARIPEGETIDRAELEINANYDSIGRALQQLVEDRKLVRVGRGRYRRAGNRKVESAATIADLVARRIDRSKRNVFLRGDFAKLGSYDAVGRALRQMTNRGRLVQIGYGLYAKAEQSPFTGRPAPLVGIKRLATEALDRLGKSVTTSEFESAYNSGRSTQVPTGRTVAVKDRVRRRIGYDGNYVVLERA
ncbi:MAG: hypothetical protein LBV29_06470 [Azoarcus sp.]|jgi:hypothetical protein|nr:hypothetical protein [Azoarcus sp.]